MLFRKPVLDRIETGEITLAFRRWKRPTVRPGGRLRTPVGELAIQAVAIIAEQDISALDAGRAGYTDRSQLMRELRQHTEGTIYRIAFRLAGPDRRLTLRTQDRLSPAELQAILDRLDRLDRGAKPWTRATLALIDAHPEMRAAELARRQGLQKAHFKGRVRQLKELGLTESLRVGYRLSPRGAKVLAAAPDACKPHTD
jgi:hypothetical protein